MKRLIFILAAVSTVLLASGCASVVDGRSKTVRINSQPVGAKFTIYNQDGETVTNEITPASVSLKRGRNMLTGENYRVSFEAPGYNPGETQIKSDVNGWFYGNIFLGGLVGIVVDGATGAMWTLSPEEISCSLIPSTATSGDGESGNLQSKTQAIETEQPRTP